MTPLRTIIVDDEKLARRGLGLRLKMIPEVEVVAECANGREGLLAIAEHSPDLVFLDLHMPGKDGQPIERYASNRARKDGELGWDEWGERLDYFLQRVARVMTPDHFIIGGGVSKRFDDYKHKITVPVPIRVAKFRNNAGIVGAAMATLQHLTDV